MFIDSEMLLFLIFVLDENCMLLLLFLLLPTDEDLKIGLVLKYSERTLLDFLERLELIKIFVLDELWS
jgi:hypothetical protein